MSHNLSDPCCGEGANGSHVANVLPSVETATREPCIAPSNVACSCLVATSQTFTLAPSTVASVRPSGDTAAVPACGGRAARSVPVATSQSLVSPYPPEIKVSPPGENPTNVTAPACGRVSGS